ncbi:MAG: 4-alpha-glucanotransferase [Streptosporangiaceae bacterium]
MTSDETRRRAAAHGVATSYRDWHGRQVEVSQRTLDAILDALGEPPGEALAEDPAAEDGVAQGAAEDGAGDGPVVPGPEDRSWGFAVQLYSVRSRQSWGHGDLGDLADLAAWSASDLGAGFILINPLHAGEPMPPLSQSPYLPMSRRFTSPLYLRIEDIPEYAKLTAGDRVRIDSLAAPLRARNATSELLDRDEVWRAKRTALQIIYRQPMTAQRRAEFDAYRAREGQPLDDWALWCALAEIHGPDWRAWPEPLRAVGSAEVAAERARLAGQSLFHAWLQWLADGQLSTAPEVARAAGMRVGIIRDLAVGCHPGGADAWAWQDVMVPGVSVGAPPDEFNQRGQDWNQPPWHPLRLAGQAYAPLADLMHAALRHAGGLRVDHVMGLFRRWWVPPGMGPDQGTYVRYDHRAMVGVLAVQAVSAGALAIGEDLGTVEPYIREYLADRGVLGTAMLWFERGPDGAPLPPGKWRRNCLATVGTHDVPPIAAFVTGEQVELRSRLGLLTRSYREESDESDAVVRAWQEVLEAEGLLPAGGRPTPAEFTVACYAFLARTPALLIGVSLADAVGDRRPQNIPGTTDEYPNWRVPLCDGEGRAVSLDDLADSRTVRAVARAVASH